MSDNRKGNNQKNINSGNGPKSSGKRKRNPNLRLIKNGDLPLEREIPGKEPLKEASSDGLKKAGSYAVKTETVKKTEAVKKTGDSKGTEEKGKAESGRKTGEKGKAESGRKTGEKGKAESGKKAKESGKTDSGKKAGESGKAESSKKTKESQRADNGKRTGGSNKTAGGKKTEEKGKTGSSKKTGETENPGRTGNSGTVKKTSDGTKSGGSKKKESGGRASAGKKSKDIGRTAGVKRSAGRAKAAHIWDYARAPVRERQSPGEWMAQHRSLVIIGFSIFVLATLLVAGYYYIVSTYTVTTVYVDGNVHYTNEEIMDMVMTGRYGKNSIYLAVKYKGRGVEGVPFVEKMDVNILSPDTIRISVYEKALAGYVEYLGQYMYFDKDGIITESSPVKTSGIPQVTGLSFEYIVLNEPLPVENEEIFKKILNITQLLTKYGLTADKIFFDSTYDVTLYFEGVRATLGDSDDLDEKIMKLQYILPELEGKRGILRMENYTEDTRNIPFNQD